MRAGPARAAFRTWGPAAAHLGTLRTCSAAVAPLLFDQARGNRVSPTLLRHMLTGIAMGVAANRLVDWTAPEPGGMPGDGDSDERFDADGEKAARLLGRPVTPDERERIANVVHVLTAAGVGLAWGWGRARWPLLRGNAGTTAGLGALLLVRGTADQAFGFTRGPRGFLGRLFFGTREPFRLLDGIGEIARV